RPMESSPSLVASTHVNGALGRGLVTRGACLGGLGLSWGACFRTSGDFDAVSFSLAPAWRPSSGRAGRGFATLGSALEPDCRKANAAAKEPASSATQPTAIPSFRRSMERSPRSRLYERSA